MILSPPSRLRRYGPTAFAWLAKPKLTAEDKRERKLVSRVGIEPTTRRLRVPGEVSTGIRPCLCARILQGSRPAASVVSTGVRVLGFQLGFHMPHDS